jgi:hypothetical protein
MGMHGIGYTWREPGILLSLPIGWSGWWLDDRSRMNREIHVRFSEGLAVRRRWATRLIETAPNDTESE